MQAIIHIQPGYFLSSTPSLYLFEIISFKNVSEFNDTKIMRKRLGNCSSSPAVQSLQSLIYFVQVNDRDQAVQE